MAIHVDIIAALDERAVEASARRLQTRMVRAGEVSAQGLTEALNREAARTGLGVDRIASSLESRLAGVGQRAGRGFGASFGAELLGSIPGVSGLASAMSGYERTSARIGATAGRALGLAFTTAAGALLAGAAYTLFKGFERYEAIDRARVQLERFGLTGQQVGQVYEQLNQIVLGTPISLADAFSSVGQLVTQNISDTRLWARYVQDVADLTGASLYGNYSQINMIMQQILAAGRLQGDEQRQLMEQGINMVSALQKAYPQLYKTMADAQKAITEGLVPPEQVFRAIETSYGGMAKRLGDTVAGAMTNLQTAVARLGANALSAIFGGPQTDEATSFKDAINAITAQLDKLGQWVNAHRDDIKRFFQGASEIVREVGTVIGNATRFFVEHRTAAYAVATAYGAIKAVGLAAHFIEIRNAARGASTAMAGMGGSEALSGLSAIAAPIALIVADLLLWKRIIDDIRGARIELSVPELPANLSPEERKRAEERRSQGGLGGLAEIPEAYGGTGPNPPPGTEWHSGWRWNGQQYVPPTDTALPSTGNDRWKNNWNPPPPIPPQWGPAPEFPGSPKTDEEKGRGRQPEAPRVPYPADYTTAPMPGETMQEWQDRLSRIQADIRVQEEQLRLDQLIATRQDADQKNDATEADIIAQQKQLTDAKIAQTQNEARLNEAKKQDIAKAETPYPAGYGAPPAPGMTREQYDRQQAVLKAQHDVSQAQARLDQVMADTGHTTEQVTAAQNDLAEANKNLRDAVLGLNESSKTAGDTLGDIGTKLDADFGASGGLAGLAENLFKFLAGLAFSPVFGAIRGAQSGLGFPGGQGSGSGLMGILGSALIPPGSTYTNNAWTNPNAQPNGSTGANGSLYGPAAQGPLDLNQIDQIAASFGLTRGSTYRNEAGSLHSENRATDYNGPPEAQAAFANYMAQNYGMDLSELIHSGGNTLYNVKNGVLGPVIDQPGSVYNSGQAGFHGDHVHIATPRPRGSTVRTQPGRTPSAPSRTPSSPASQAAPDLSSPQGIARYIYNAALQRGYSPSEAVSIVAYAVGESGLNPSISGGIQGDDEVLGLFQQKSGFARAGGIDPSQRTDPQANTTAYLNQLQQHRGQGTIYDQLLATSVGGPMYTGGLPAMVGLEQRAHGFLGFQHGGASEARVPIIEPPRPPPDNWSDIPGIPKWIGPNFPGKELPKQSPYPYPPADKNKELPAVPNPTRPPAFPYHPDPKNPIQMYQGAVPGYGGGDQKPVLLEPGEHVLPKEDVDAMGGQGAVYDFRARLKAGDVGAGPSPPPPPMIPGADMPGFTGTVGGPTPGMSPVGAAAPPQGYGGGFRVTGGGLVGVLESIPATAINYGIQAAAAAGAAAAGAQTGGAVEDLPITGGGGLSVPEMGGAPGSASSVGGSPAGAAISAALNIAFAELNAAISAGGQAAAAVVGGLQQTFGLQQFAQTPLAQQSWLTRLMGGFIGAQPQLPNLAGLISSAVSPTTTAATKQQGAAVPQSGPLVHIENYNANRGEDHAGGRIAAQFQTAYSESPLTGSR